MACNLTKTTHLDAYNANDKHDLICILNLWDFIFFFSIIITMYIYSLVTKTSKIKVNKTRHHRTQKIEHEIHKIHTKKY